MNRILRYLADHALAVAGLVVAVLALAGGSYAALSNSAGNIRAWARVSPDGHLIAGAGGPRSVEQSSALYVISWKAPVGGRCATTAVVDAIKSRPNENVNNTHFVAGYASAGTFSHRRSHVTTVETFNQSGQPTPMAFDVVVAC